MVETEWSELSGIEVEYSDNTWGLTGIVDVRGTGDSLDVKAKQVGDIRGKQVDPRFAIETPSASLTRIISVNTSLCSIERIISTIFS